MQLENFSFHFQLFHCLGNKQFNFDTVTLRL